MSNLFVLLSGLTLAAPEVRQLDRPLPGESGKTVNRSTGIKAKADALQIAKGWELEAARERDKQRQQVDASISTSAISDVIARAERMARQGRLNATSAREIINELLIAAGQATVEAVTERGWCEGWLLGKSGTVAAVSHKAYHTTSLLK